METIVIASPSTPVRFTTPKGGSKYATKSKIVLPNNAEEIVRELSLKDLDRQAIMFPVKKEKTALYDTASDKEYSIIGQPQFDLYGKKCKKRLHNVCSDKYHLLPNDQLFPVLEKLFVEAGIKFTATYRHIDYDKFYVEYVLTGESKAVLKEKDIIFPKVQVFHSYNGKVQCQLNFGLFRLVCSNGLCAPVADRSNLNIKVKHTDKMADEFVRFMSHIADYLEQFKSNELTKQLAEMAKNEVTDVPARIDEVAKAIKEYPKTTVDLALTIIQKESNVLGYKKANDWLVYNGLNEALHSNLSDKHPEFKYQIDSDVFDWLLNNPSKN